MTPKEKSIQLFNKMVSEMPLQNNTNANVDYIFKQCALIAVDEMIIQNGELYLNGLDGIYYRKKNNYLFELKTEIEKL